MSARRGRLLAMAIATVASIVGADSRVALADQITYEPTAGVPTFAVREPVLRLKPGDIVETRTFSKPGDYYERARGPWPGEVGPFHIDGVTPDDTLVVKILKLRPNRDTAVSAVNPTGISAVAGDSRTRMLNDPLPARRYVWQIDRARNVGILDIPNSASKRIELPLKPMLGRVAVAPAGEEAWGGLWPGNFGGNMDASDVREGTTVFLPVFHPGALFYFGDAHALQGDGEIVGSGLETTMDVTFQFDVIKGRKIRWPRYEDAEHIMVAGSIRPLVDAFRIAQVELIEWLVEDYGFDKLDAYQVLSQAGVTRVANVVDPNYTVVAKFPKSALPPRVTRGNAAAAQGAGTGSGAAGAPRADSAALRVADLQRELERLARGFDGRVGVCVRDGAGAACVNGDQRSSMQSVMKLLVAIATLDRIDRGTDGWTLDTPVLVRKQDLSLFVQPIAKLVTAEGYKTTIGDLVRRAVVDSDSAATDILIARLGGTNVVQAVIDRHGITGVRIDRDERHLNTNTIGLEWRPEFVDTEVFDRARAAVPEARRAVAFREYQKDVRDTSTPSGMASLLHALAEGTLLSAGSTKYLLDVMEQTVTFPDRLKAGVTTGWTLGHKTGTSGAYKGITVASNDVGILTAPDGHRVSIAVFISDTHASSADCGKLMAKFARAAIAHYR